MYDAGLTSWAGLDGACGGGWVGRRTPPAAAACQRPARGPRGWVSAERPRASTRTCRQRQIPDPAGARRVESGDGAQRACLAADRPRWGREHTDLSPVVDSGSYWREVSGEWRRRAARLPAWRLTG